MDMLRNRSNLKMACGFNDQSYTFALVNSENALIYYKNFNHPDKEKLSRTFIEDLEQFDLLGESCELILLANEYQLILMDALSVPQNEMRKALRWHLKGLCDYDLDDAVIDFFSVPMRKNQKTKQIFVAITPMALLYEKINWLESKYLNVSRASIPDLALRKIIPFLNQGMAELPSDPIIIISFSEQNEKLYIFFEGHFYLIRELTPKNHPIAEEEKLKHMIYELERSIQFCAHEINLPKPQKIFFTPGRPYSVAFLEAIAEKLELTTAVIDLNQCLTTSGPILVDDCPELFFIIGAALKPLNEMIG